MNIRLSHSLLLILSIISLTSCGGKSGASGQNDGAESPDSMMYYFGIMQANNFRQDATNDTILLTPEGRKQFLAGFKAAMKVESDDDSYNQGLQLGLRLAIRLREFEKMYGVKFSESELIKSFEECMMSDNPIDISAAQKGYYAIKDRLDLRKNSKESESAIKELARQAREDGFTMVSDTLFAKDITQSAGGPKFKDGDHIAIQVNAATLDGRELGRQFPDSITIGAGRVPRIICLATHTMTSGQTRTFMTTPKTIFGNQFANYQLRSDEPIVFTIKAERN